MGKNFEKILPYLNEKYRECTSFLRVMPDFIIFGAKKCGTTSLYNYLIQHPCIIPAKQKEIHFFGTGAYTNYNKGINWYKSNFPTIIQKRFFELFKRFALTGEASPHYISQKLVAERIYKCLPDVKLIFILRNPIERAYSHYNHKLTKGKEKSSFEEVVAMELAMLKKKNTEICKEKTATTHHYNYTGYISRGLYEQQLKKWFEFFPKKNLFFVLSEDLFKNPEEELNKLFKFLSLPEYRLKEYKKFRESANKSGNIDAECRKMLKEYYEPFNQKLYELLDRDLKWE